MELLAELWEQAEAQRLSGQRALLAIVAEVAALRPGLKASTATDILFAIGSPETYRLLVVDRCWSPERFERWYADILARLLFG